MNVRAPASVLHVVATRAVKVFEAEGLWKGFVTFVLLSTVRDNNIVFTLTEIRTNGLFVARRSARRWQENYNNRLSKCGNNYVCLRGRRSQRVCLFVELHFIYLFVFSVCWEETRRANYVMLCGIELLQKNVSWIGEGGMFYIMHPFRVYTSAVVHWTQYVYTGRFCFSKFSFM